MVSPSTTLRTGLSNHDALENVSFDRLRMTFFMDYLLHILILITIYSILALSLNLLIGYLGILQLGHPALYFGVGAYSFAILSQRGAGFFLALLGAAVFSLVIGALFIIPALRLKSHYIAIATFGFLAITQGVIIQLREITRGPLGFPGIPRPEIFGFLFQSNFSFFVLALIFAIFIGCVVHRIVHSPFGKLLEAIREDETAVKTLGFNTILPKAQIFLASSFFAGIGGALLASYLGFIGPTNLTASEVILVISMVIVGGMASFWGSIAGAAIMILLSEALRFLGLPSEIVGAGRFALFGLILILFMLFRPHGLFGQRTNIFSK